MVENNIIGAILAGGKSRRFGVDKCNIKLGDKTLIEHTISKIEKVSESEFEGFGEVVNEQQQKFEEQDIRAQMLAEQLAEEQYGKQFYDLSQDQQM